MRNWHVSVRATALLVVVLTSVIGLGACGGGGPRAAISSLVPTASPSPTGSPISPSPAPFTSSHYHFSLTSAQWTGTDATTAWNGKGSPGDGDPTVDILVGPDGQRAFAFGERTTASLEHFVATQRLVNTKVHPCSVKPESTRSTTVGGEPAVLDEEHCPASVGPFVITAFVVHGGWANVFFTYSIPAGSEAFTRTWFESLLQLVALDR